MQPKNKEMAIQIQELLTGECKVPILGTSPLIMNAMHGKTAHGLVLPPPKGSRNKDVKHVPMEEFEQSMHMIQDLGAPTAVCIPATAFKGAMCTAALELPDTKKAQIGRLTWVDGYRVPIWGVPQIYMARVVQAGPGHTPDIRTRAIFPEWASLVPVRFVKPHLNQTTIANLLQAGGLIAGVGDGRQEKGKLSFGQFRVVSPSDKDFLHLIKAQGRAEQMKAMEAPECFDEPTAEILTWYAEECTRRGLKVRQVPLKKARNAA